MTVQELQHLSLELEGVHYSLFVEGEEGTMWGTWKCEECGTGGRSAKTFFTIDDAIKAARADLETHHLAYHALK